MKRMLVMMIVVVMMVLPYSALAADGLSPLQSSAPAINEASARDYEIKFGSDRGVGDNDTWAIYSAPSLNAIRGANGKAMVHTSEPVYIGGWNGAWLLVRYEKDNGGYRVGWVPNTMIGTNLETSRSVNFAYWDVEVGRGCVLTDDPLLESEGLAYVSAGMHVTYLARYQYREGGEFAYIQSELDGQPVCGFIPFDAIRW